MKTKSFQDLHSKLYCVGLSNILRIVGSIEIL